jgi:hypothetical protein
MKKILLIAVLTLTGCAPYVREVPVVVYSDYEPAYTIHRREYPTPAYVYRRPYYVDPWFGGFLLGVGTGYVFWH